MKIIILVSKAKLISLVLNESTRTTVGQFTARRDPPHFIGDEYHGHCKLPGGKEVSWTITGSRRHPNKFPADNKIPADAKAAVAKVLNVAPSILETFIAFDEIENENVFVIQERAHTFSEWLSKHNNDEN